MTKKVALIIAYFGTLPPYSKFFFHSLKFNPEVDVILITDQEVSISLDNLIVIKKEFNELKDDIQKLFDFEIVLDTPYKLCDYKTVYGMLLEENLTNYDFWGYCDMDMVLGDILSFLPEDILNEYDKLYEYGHLTLYRNTLENNRRFMQDAGMDYKKVFTTPVIKVFDEVEGIQDKYEKLGIPTYKYRDFADISPWQYQFRRVESNLNEIDLLGFNYQNQLFFWENGIIYRAYINRKKEVSYDTFNYLHFQKRNLEDKFGLSENTESFFITNKGFVSKELGFNVTVEQINQLNPYSLFKEIEKRLSYFKFIWIRRFKKYILNR